MILYQYPTRMSSDLRGKGGFGRRCILEIDFNDWEIGLMTVCRLGAVEVASHLLPKCPKQRAFSSDHLVALVSSLFHLDSDAADIVQIPFFRMRRSAEFLAHKKPKSSCF